MASPWPKSALSERSTRCQVLCSELPARGIVWLMHRSLTALLLIVAACGSESSEPPSIQEPVVSESTPELPPPAPVEEPTPEEPAPSYAPVRGAIRVVVIGEAPLLASQTEACTAFARRLGEGASFQMADDEESTAIEALLQGEDAERPSSWFTSETVVALAFRAPYNERVGVGLRGHVVIHGESMRPRVRYRADLSDPNHRNMFAFAHTNEGLAMLIGFVRNGGEG